jgi:pseudaminic acid biosynthesis-associated methylase
MTIGTDQEAFWRGTFGDDYVDRNRGSHWVAANTALFAKMLSCTRGIRTVLELGANIGLNLMALRRLLPDATLSAIEINAKAAAELAVNVPGTQVQLGSILEVNPSSNYDLVMTKGVLIHINPDKLPLVYSLMYRCSARYLLVAEYYNPKPVEVIYKGHAGKLFKRDFAGEIMDQYSDLRLVEYGFAYHRDNNFPQDDLNWFLMEKATLN